MIMSMGSWYIIITKLYEQREDGAQASAAQQEVLERAARCRQAPTALKEGSPFRFIAEQRHRGDRAARRRCPSNIDLNTGSRCRSSARSTTCRAALQDGLAFLATVGSTAPFVGLFGTVWGIYHALTAIGIAGQASIDKVAGPVGEALIMTAIGLAVAVPAVLGYNWLIRASQFFPRAANKAVDSGYSAASAANCISASRA